MGAAVATLKKQLAQEEANEYEAVAIAVEASHTFGGYEKDEMEARLRHEFRTLQPRKCPGKIREKDFVNTLLKIKHLQMTDRFDDRAMMASLMATMHHEFTTWVNRNGDDEEWDMIVWQRWLDGETTVDHYGPKPRPAAVLADNGEPGGTDDHAAASASQRTSTNSAAISHDTSTAHSPTTPVPRGSADTTTSVVTTGGHHPEAATHEEDGGAVDPSLGWRGVDALWIMQQRRLFREPHQLRKDGVTIPQFIKAGLIKDIQAAYFDMHELVANGLNTVPLLESSGYILADLKQLNTKRTYYLREEEMAERKARKDAERLEKLRQLELSEEDEETKDATAATDLNGDGDEDGTGFDDLGEFEGGFNTDDDLQALREAGFNAMVLKKKVKLNVKQLKAAGYSVHEITEAGVWGVSGAAKLRDAGFTVAEMMGEFSAGQLKQAGFEARELQDAGISLVKIRESGVISAAELRLAGFTAIDMRKAFYNAEQMKEAGYTAAELKEAGYNAPQLRFARFIPMELKQAGFNAGELRRAELPAYDMKVIGFTATELREGGYSAKELQTGGFTVQHMFDAGFSATQLRFANYTAQELRGVGMTAPQLLEALYTPVMLAEAGFSAKQLADAGINAKKLRELGFSAGEVNNAMDFSSVKELIQHGGFTPVELRGAGYTAKELIEAGISVVQCRKAGYHAGEMREAGVSVVELKSAGYSAQQLVKDGGFTDPIQLKQMGFKYNALKLAGFTDQRLVLEARFSVKEVVRATGYNEASLHRSGFKASELKAYGFGAAKLVKCGSLWAPPGVHNRVSLGVLDGWELHRKDRYCHATTAADLSSIPETAEWVLVAAKRVADDELYVVATCPRAEVLRDTTMNKTHESNGTWWYRCAGRAFGFSDKSTIDLKAVSDWAEPESEARLSWVLDHKGWGGRRAGCHCDLTFDDEEWEKCIWYS